MNFILSNTSSYFVRKLALLFVVAISVSLFGAKSAFADDKEEFSETKQQILSYYNQHFQDIGQILSQNQEKYRADPQALMEFVNSELMPNWSAERTIMAILGVDLWKSLSLEQQTALIEEYGQTMRRYIFETFAKYHGQVVEAQTVKMFSSGKKAWMTVSIDLEPLPSVSLDFKLYQVDDNWKIYDFSFQGVSFIKMKQSEYQQTLSEKGFDTLLSLLKQKNDMFFDALNDNE